VTEEKKFCWQCARWKEIPPAERILVNGKCKLAHRSYWPADSKDRACDAFESRHLPVVRNSMANPRVVFMLMFDCPLGGAH